MNYLAYICSIALFRFLSLLPLFMIHFFADLLYLLMYYVVGYRKKIAFKNLRLAFPDYNEKSLRKTAKKFYLHLADVLIESAATQYFPRWRLEKMYRIKDAELFSKYYERGKSIMVITGHYNTWEWSVPGSYTMPHTFLGVYKPLKNKYFDKAIKKIRGRYGARMIPMKKISRELINVRENQEKVIVGMVADQRPMKSNIQYWTDFLGLKTPVFLGPEKLAKKFNLVVVFVKTRKLKRGVYQAEFEVITEKPGEMKEHEITDHWMSLLEKEIQEEPAYWLWTHDRWKHPYPGNSS